MDDGPFCAIVGGIEPPLHIYRGDRAHAFLDAGPASTGHTLVVPAEHYRTLPDVPRPTAGAVSEVVHDVGTAIESAFDPAGLSIVQSNGAVAGQDVDHVHVHILPRYADDEVTIKWVPEAADTRQAGELTDRIAAEL